MNIFSLEKKLREVKLYGLENLNAQIAIEEAADFLKAIMETKNLEKEAGEEFYKNHPFSFSSQEEAFLYGFESGAFWTRSKGEVK